jgi:hypothetical protein
MLRFNPSQRISVAKAVTGWLVLVIPCRLLYPWETSHGCCEEYNTDDLNRGGHVTYL